MEKLFFILFISIYISTNYYVLKRILQWDIVDKSKNKRIIISIIYLVTIITPLITFGMSSRNIGRIVGTIGNYGIGIYFFLFSLFIIVDLILVILKKTKIKKSNISKKTNRYLGVSLIGILFVIGFYGNYNASNIVETSYNIKVEKRDSSGKELKAVLLTDIHLGYTNGVNHLEKIVEDINRVDPDIVFISGDIFDGNYHALANPEKAKELLKSIKSKYGVYASLGNHDSGASYNEMVSFLEYSKVNVLRDEKVKIDNKFVLVGRKDSQPIGYDGEKRKEIESVLKDKDMNLPVIVLDHRPSNFKEYTRGEDLILSGHTHNGQLVPFNIITSKANITNYGYFIERGNKTQMVVSSGVGTWGPPLRIGTVSEIVKLNIEFK